MVNFIFEWVLILSSWIANNVKYLNTMYLYLLSIVNLQKIIVSIQYKWVDHSIKITKVYAQCKQCQLWIVLFYWYSFPFTLRRWQINLGVSKVSRALCMILTSLSETNLCYIFCGNSKGDNRYIFHWLFMSNYRRFRETFVVNR